MPAEWRYSLTIDDYLTGVKAVRQFTLQLAKSLEFSPEDEFGLELAIDEAVTNAWEASQKPVRVSFVLDRNLLTIFVIDQGKGISLGAKCSLNELDINGRGCYLMQSYMNEVTWEPQEGGGMCCILKKQVTLPQKVLESLIKIKV